MPLPLPVLDDRGFQELADGMRERLPRTAPGWTEHNASDPGITLFELFAYLGDALLYRFDRVPARHYRAFLRLIGCEPRVARVACVPVTLACAPGQARDLPAGLQIASSRSPVTFQTRTPFHATDAGMSTLLVCSSGKWIDRSDDNRALGAAFAPFGADPKAGDALYLGFDRAPAAADARLHLWVFGGDFEQDRETWQALWDEQRRARKPKHCGSWIAHYGASIVWEYFNGQAWQSLPGLKDRTRALSLSGPVRWRAAAAHVAGGVPGHAAKYFIRCRLVTGAYDCAPQIRGVRINTVLAHHAVDEAGVIDPARSTGAARQRFMLSRWPVVPRSLRLNLTDTDGIVATDWRERMDFDRSGPHARHFVLDHQSGQIEFGDGRAGAVPDAGLQLTALWRVGGGISGNVPAGTLDTVRGIATLAATQPVTACGGADAEMLDAVKARAFHKIHTERCAATLQDLERIVLEAPALPIAKAFAVAEAHPDMECLPVAGCVTVVILPRCIESSPMPSVALCTAIANYIEPRRPLALEVHVSGPRYTAVRVTATLALMRGADRARVLADANTAMRKFLHPLHGGPADDGWIVGRTVYRSEVLAVLQAIAGVHHVVELTLAAGEGRAALCGDIPICANGLVVSGDHVFKTTDGATR